MEKKNQMVAATNNAVQPVAFNFFDPAQFETMQRVSRMFAASDLVPDNYKPKLEYVPSGASEAQIQMIQQKNASAQNKAIANCMIALEMANRIGASPLMVMQNLIVIYGRPSWSSKFLIATVNTCGRFEPLKYKFTNKGMLGKVEYVDYVWNKQTNRKEQVKKEFDGTKIPNLECVAYTTAKGSENVLESSPISIEMAIKEGWYTKSGSKWQTMPKQMLMYRAASWWSSAYAPEISMGMRTVEENEDIHNVEDADAIEIKDDDLQAAIAANANKNEIGMDEGDPEGDKGAQVVYDKETGKMVGKATGEIIGDSNPSDNAGDNGENAGSEDAPSF